MKPGWALACLLLFIGAFLAGRFGATGPRILPQESGQLRIALEEGDPLERAARLSRYLEGLQRSNVDESTRIIEEHHRFFTQQEHLLLMTAWTRFDPSAALDWATSQEGRMKRRATLAFVEAMAYLHPAAAAELIEENDDLDLADRMHDHLIRGWARSDHIDKLTVHIMAISRPDRRKTATIILANELMKRGPDQLKSWAAAVPEDAPGGYKTIAFRNAADSLSMRDPEEAAIWIEDYAQHDHGRGALELVARRWSARSWASALDWLTTIPPSDEQKRALKKLFGEWLRKRPQAAESWARDAAPDISYDPVVRVIVQRAYWERPEVAMDWAHLIAEDEVRDEAQLGIGRSWYSRDAEAFMDWLPDSGLEQRIQDQILASF